MIAREGVVPAVTSLLLSAAAAGLGSPAGAAAGVLLSLAILWAFRDDDRVTPSLPLALVSPADGRVIGSGIRTDPWLRRQCVRISMKLSLLGMGVIRSPTEGQVKEFWVRGGVRRDAGPDSASSPTCYALWIQTDEGDDVVVAVYGRRFISRFKADVSPGERIGHGHRLGFIYFGTAVALYAPEHSSIGDDEEPAKPKRVLGGTDVVATLVHRESEDSEEPG